MRVLILLLILVSFGVSNAQKKLEFKIDIQPALLVEAGEEQLVFKGASIQLGGEPTATGGTANYSYLWTPNTFLDNPNIANPIATPESDITYTVEVSDGICVRNDQIVLRVSTITSNDLEDSRDLTVYPNPASNKVRLEMPSKWQTRELLISFYDLSGNLIFSEEGIIDQLEIDVSGWAKSTYILHITGEEIDLTSKVQLR